MKLKKSKAGYQGAIVNADGDLVKQGDPSLVVDLPDGQKLIVGELPEGTIIEVATWRGTGRPDSRANRLLLGVGSAKSFTPPQEQSSVDRTVNPAATQEDETSNTRPIPAIRGIAKLSARFKRRIEKQKLRREDNSAQPTRLNGAVYLKKVLKIGSETLDSSGLDSPVGEFMNETLSGKPSVKKRTVKKVAARRTPAKRSTARKSTAKKTAKKKPAKKRYR